MRKLLAAILLASILPAFAFSKTESFRTLAPASAAQKAEEAYDRELAVFIREVWRDLKKSWHKSKRPPESRFVELRRTRREIEKHRTGGDFPSLIRFVQILKRTPGLMDFGPHFDAIPAFVNELDLVARGIEELERQEKIPHAEREIFISTLYRYGLSLSLSKTVSPEALRRFVAENSAQERGLHFYSLRRLCEEMILRLKADRESHWPPEGLLAKSQIYEYLFQTLFGDWRHLAVLGPPEQREEKARNLFSDLLLHLSGVEGIAGFEKTPEQMSFHYATTENSAYDRSLSGVRVSFLETKLRGAKLSKIHPSFRICLGDSDCRDVDFRGAFLARANFEDASLRGADFRGAILSEKRNAPAERAMAQVDFVSFHAGESRRWRREASGGVLTLEPIRSNRAKYSHSWMRCENAAVERTRILRTQLNRNPNLFTDAQQEALDVEEEDFAFLEETSLETSL